MIPVMRTVIHASDVLTLAEKFAGANELELVTVSSRVFGDSKKLAAIRGGADLTLERADKAVRWFSENWPASAPWPSDVARPQKEAA